MSDDLFAHSIFSGFCLSIQEEKDLGEVDNIQKGRQCWSES